MTSGILVQLLFDLILLASVVFLWVKMHRPQKDDPRLSRGLQLLQSKIAVLEDLSDQVETQVQQISSLIEMKGKEVQNQILQADQQIQKIQASMGKSLEVAKIFQDRIPHQEIIERQNTVKYVKAARLAHEGKTVEEIAGEVELTRGEIELIAKVNRDQLQFSVEDLPEWIKEEVQTDEIETFESARGFESQPLARNEDRLDLSTLGERFRQGVGSMADQPAATSRPESLAPVRPNGLRPQIEMPHPQSNPNRIREMVQTTSGKTVEIQRVVFPRVDTGDFLA